MASTVFCLQMGGGALWVKTPNFVDSVDAHCTARSDNKSRRMMC